MPLDVDKVKHLAYLARISIDDESIDLYSKHMDKVIEYFNILDEIDSADVEPYRILKHIEEFRDDICIVNNEDMLRIAKNVKDRFIKAPRIV